MEIREDRFQAGDEVTFIAADDYTDDRIQQDWRKFGRGPYAIEAVEDIPQWWGKHSTGHGQLVYVNGERYSGAWFNPVPRRSEAA